MLLNGPSVLKLSIVSAPCLIKFVAVSTNELYSLDLILGRLVRCVRIYQRLNGDNFLEG
jgi:hypothetical protein